MSADASSLLLGLHAFATLGMMGVAWFVQLVHYPLFDHVERSRFSAFERQHQRRTGWVVGPLMLAELGTSVALVWLLPVTVSRAAAAVALGAVIVLWLSTWLVQVPLHRRLASGFDEDAHRRLVATSRLRTALWTARGCWAAWLAAA